MQLIVNLLIGGFVYGCMWLAKAPEWACVGSAIVSFHIFTAADYIVDKLKPEPPHAD